MDYSSDGSLSDFMVAINKVADFHRKFGLPIRATPTAISKEEREFRATLVEEETKELVKVCKEFEGTTEDFVNLLKEMSDLLYVIFGVAVTFGVDEILDSSFDSVHDSNMSKLGEDGKPLYREDGKVLKGPNYFKAEKFIERTFKRFYDYDNKDELPE